MTGAIKANECPTTCWMVVNLFHIYYFLVYFHHQTILTENGVQSGELKQTMLKKKKNK